MEVAIMADLSRFLSAQEYDYETALGEIRRGRKCSCWMWYIFPQIQGLGTSGMSRYYAIKNMQEAIDYINHAILGKRLVEITEALLQLESNDALAVMGCPDDMKLKSSMTLFSYAAPQMQIFQAVLNKFFDGEECHRTKRILGV